MPSIVKPVATHPSLQRNTLGLTIRDYEGTMSTLCAGCGHDSITAAITRAFWETATEPHMVAKLSGIGCSSKTPAYFVLNLHTSYQLTPNLQLFGLLQNAFNTTYYTFGTFSPTSSVFLAQAPGATNPRSYSPGAPIAGTIGVRVIF